MTKSIFSAQYDRLCTLLIEAREAAGYSQAELAKCLKHPQSYVSKYETKQRRLDIVEFLEIVRCLHLDGPEMLRHLSALFGGGDEASTMLRRSERVAARKRKKP